MIETTRGQMRTIGDELDEAIAMFRSSADTCSDRYQAHADKYDETDDLREMAQGEYELGRAAGYLAAANHLHRIRALVVASGADRIPAKGQKVSR